MTKKTPFKIKANTVVATLRISDIKDEEELRRFRWWLQDTYLQIAAISNVEVFKKAYTKRPKFTLMRKYSKYDR